MKMWWVCASFFILSSSAFAQCRRDDPHVHFQIRRVSNAGLKMHEASDEKALREYLMAKNNIYFLSTPKSAGAYLVLEPNYLNARQFQRQAQDIADALEGIPEITGRAFEGLPITYYIYQVDAKRPTSFSDQNGILPGRLGVMLTLSVINDDPTFHETTHLTEKNWSTEESETLSEGVADYVQRECRPGKAYAFNEKNSNPDKLARKYLAGPHTQSFLGKIGSQGKFDDQWENMSERFAFYAASFSFVRYLLTQGSLQKILRLQDAAADPALYQKLYSRSLEELRQDWLEKLQQKK